MNGPAASLGVVAAGFAPIKGTRHLARDRVDLAAAGPVGDRRYCLVDRRSHQVLRTVRNPSLLAVRAGPERDRLRVEVPGGASVSAVPEPSGERIGCDYWGRRVDLTVCAGPHAELFSDYLGRPVRLAEAPPGAVVFSEPVTLISLASLRELAEGLDRPALLDQAARFRATFVIDTDAPAYAEEGWLGRDVRVGDARLRLGAAVPRCAVIDLDPDTGRRDLPLLKTLARHRPSNAAGEPCFGVFARVLTPGTVHPDSARS